MRLISDAAPTERVGRYPKHRFHTKREQPYSIHPFCFAPVLPGETLQSAFMEARCITDPVVSPIIGWKKDMFFFYVTMSDLLLDALKDMFVDPTNTDLSATLGIGADDTKFFTAKGGVPYASYCYQKIVEWYFRDEGEAWNVKTLASGLAVAQIRDVGWMDSLTDESDMPEGAAISGATDAGDLERLVEAFQMLRAMGLSDMTYEDMLRSQGINIPEAAVGRPELLWHMSNFQYPSNTIDPTDGTPTSAVSWVFKESMKKAKMFKEPGFIMGVSVTRPKVYMGGQFGNMTAHLSRAWDWLPAYLPPDMAETRLKYFSAGTGPLGDRSGTGAGTESEYWVDVADLFVHGDEWRDFNLASDLTASWGTHTAGLPNWSLGEDSMVLRYLGDAGVKGFFVDAAGTEYYIRSDGYVSFAIKGKVTDMTQTAAQLRAA